MQIVMAKIREQEREKQYGLKKIGIWGFRFVIVLCVIVLNISYG